MKLIAPDYYPEFHCTADQCTHTCCVGWEIDVDPDTLARYQHIPGRFGQRLKQSIQTAGEVACFRLSEDERCPFLNDHGLCDIILTLGEDALCQICADHPRFRNFFSDRTEIGLGLCCEAAGTLILSRRTPVRLITLDEDCVPAALSAKEQAIIALREELLSIAQDRSRTVSERLDAILRRANVSLPALSCREWAHFYTDLERLDPAWDVLLNELHDVSVSTVERRFAVPFEQLLVYFLYRHLADAQDAPDLAGRIGFCVHAVQFIQWLCAHRLDTHGRCRLEDLIELCRLYSSEIEYSEENLQALFQLFAP